MKIVTTTEFRQKLTKQLTYISKDKPLASKKYKKLIFREIKKLAEMPYKNQKSKFFDLENIRNLVIKGYTIVYRIEKD